MAEHGKNIGVIVPATYFDLKQTFDCGQCFRYRALDDNTYYVIAKGKLLRLQQKDNNIIFFCSEEEYLSHWKEYFDLDRDYGEVQNVLLNKDEKLKRAINEYPGIRILKQEPWEMLISFIISQSKQIPHIKQLIERISQTFGTMIGTIDNEPCYSFPTPYEMKDVTEDMMRQLKVGYRAPYIVDAINKVNSGQLDLNELFSLPYQEAKKALLQIKGVGDKVADCVLLFAYGKHEAFPTDVWVKRVMTLYYFDNADDESVSSSNVSIERIKQFANEYFGELSGFAQQYLFHYARMNKTGK